MSRHCEYGHNDVQIDVKGDAYCEVCGAGPLRVGDEIRAFLRGSRILTDAELEEIKATAGCSFGEGARPYYITDLLHTATSARKALGMLRDQIITAGRASDLVLEAARQALGRPA